MASQSQPGTDSPYLTFRQRPDYGGDDGSRPNIPMTIVDKDRTVLFETEMLGLLKQIIRQNDVVALEQYLAKRPVPMCRQDGLPGYGDVFSMAAQSGSVHVLRALLEHSATDSTQSNPFEELGFVLLNVAAASAQPDVVRFLLDNEPAYADIHARDPSGYTAIGSAASLDGCGLTDLSAWQRESLDRSEKTMSLLLDRGACASDVVFLPWNRRHGDEASNVIRDTVLTLAARWASSELMQRLIDGGANVHAKARHNDCFLDAENDDLGVTALCTSSMHSNFDAIKVLLDRRGAGVDIADMVSSRDSRGSLPLHWAARNPLYEEIRLTPTSRLAEMVQRIISTMELLLESNPATINIQDDHGNTPLHYASKNYGTLGKEHTDIFKVLCDRGADASLLNNKRQTPLHTLCYCENGGMPIDAAAIAILLEHGAKATDADDAGNTPLHHAARNLDNLDAVDFLLAHGADVTTRNQRQNTPLHEAARGIVWPRGPDMTADDRIKAQDGMMSRLENAGGDGLMDEPNAEGKTPRELRVQTLSSHDGRNIHVFCSRRSNEAIPQTGSPKALTLLDSPGPSASTMPTPIKHQPVPLHGPAADIYRLALEFELGEFTSLNYVPTSAVTTVNWMINQGNTLSPLYDSQELEDGISVDFSPEPRPIHSLFLVSRTVRNEIRAIIFSESVIAVSSLRYGGLRILEEAGPLAWRELRTLVVCLRSCHCLSQLCVSGGWPAMEELDLRDDENRFFDIDRWPHNKRLGSVSRNDRNRLAEWQRICEAMAAYGQPDRLELFLACDPWDLELAQRIVQPLYSVPRLRNLVISFGNPSKTSQRVLARDTILKLLGISCHVEPFRF
ncbi:hypothetical protein ACJ41O_011811 [Fusarium nematophilum]